MCMVLLLMVALALGVSVPALAASPLANLTPPTTFTVPQGLEMDWNARHHYEEYVDLFNKLHEAYPQLTNLYSIGHSYQERDLWCLEITNSKKKNDDKVGIGVFGNIHGGEQEGGESALYTAWWILLNSDSKYVKTMLDNYIIYVVPIINPDGYEQSFIYNNRWNLRPTDHNGDGVVFSDPYTDINGDGVIATIYKGTATSAIADRVKIGMESPDWDGNGILGDDPRTSDIDLNRSFDYQWNRYDIETYKTPNTVLVGENSLARAGLQPGAEPETQAVQNFLYAKPMNALVTLHTGQQSVLWPRCYTGNDFSDPADKELLYMSQVGEKMTEALEETTGRSYYCKSSHDDYPSSGDMIDFAFGRLNIHAYTVEVYVGGDPDPDPNAPEWDKHTWGNKMPEDTWKFYSYQEVKDVLKLDPAKLGLKTTEGLWFNNTSSAQMAGKAPEDQDILVQGAKDAILVMIESEPNGAGYQRPAYVDWL